MMRSIESLPSRLLSAAGLALIVLTAGCSSSGRVATEEPATEPAPAVQTAEAVDEAPAEAVAPTMADTVHAGRYDNGKMWTFEYPPLDYLEETYGFRPDDAWFEKARLGALRIPGCTASFVSPNGLVMTNHHCGRSSVADVSKEGEHLLENGFYARSLDEERPAEEMYADQLIAIEDVTDEVNAAIDAAQTDAERVQARKDAIEQIQQRLAEAAGGEDAGIVVQVISLYNGGRYSAYTFKRYDDVRLVVAPELQMGHFGGDPDNFTYPRYSLDFTFFRVYDENGEPLQTENYFPWSEEGADEGDVVFVIGNPGSTNRLETVAQLEFRRDVQEKYILAYLKARLDALRTEYEENPSDALLTEILSLSNAQKLYRGRVRGLNDPIVMARRADTERQFLEAVQADSALNARYGDLVDDLAAIQQQKYEFGPEFGAFLGMQPQSGLASATLRRALMAYMYLKQQESGVPAEGLAPIKEQLLKIEDLPDARERRFLTIRLRELEQHLGDDPALQQVMGAMTPAEKAEAILGGTALADSAQAAEALANGTLTMNDPALEVIGAIIGRMQQFQSAYAGLSAQEQELNRIRGRAQYDVYGTTIPPDATFSLRLADGVVDGYAYNGTIAPPHTTFYGLYDHYYSYRETEKAHEWDLPERWLHPPTTFDRSTPMDLVSTNDIIGGNSGSPLLNKDLEIVGLVFDGNIESLPSAFIFLTERGRTVSVDARGILEALDEIYDADRVVLELTSGQLTRSEEEADEVRASRP